MSYVQSLRLMLQAIVRGPKPASDGSSATARWVQRCSMFVLYLGLSLCAVTNVARADPAGCTAIANILSSDACDGPDPYYPTSEYLTCYTVPGWTPGNTAIRQIMTSLVHPGNTVEYTLSEYYCSAAPGKNLGRDTPTVGDPINPSNGNKYLEDVDFQGGAVADLHALLQQPVGHSP